MWAGVWWGPDRRACVWFVFPWRGGAGAVERARAAGASFTGINWTRHSARPVQCMRRTQLLVPLIAHLSEQFIGEPQGAHSPNPDISQSLPAERMAERLCHHQLDNHRALVSVVRQRPWYPHLYTIWRHPYHSPVPTSTSW